MKLIIFLMGIILFCFPFSVSPTTIDGRFIFLDTDSSTFSVLLQINTDTGTDDLGGTTIVFNYDTSTISFTGTPVKDVDYIFHNFDDANYSPATVTRPMNGEIWINIDLPFINNNDGTLVAGSPEWTDVVTIHFDILDPNSTANLSWLTASIFWGIYDADNATLWETGEFQDLQSFPLPVELISFTGTLLSNDNVLLEWKTASSLNNYGFEIEKSYLNSKVWNEIGFVENHGDPNSMVEYSFTDTTSHSFSVIKYRLKSIDNDGSFEYSYIIEVNAGLVNYELAQNYPNPFNSSTKIKFTIPAVFVSGSKQFPSVTLIVYDVLGNEITTLVNEEKEPGIYEVEFSAVNLASGIYIYRLTAGNPSAGSPTGQSGYGFVETKKMVLLR